MQFRSNYPVNSRIEVGANTILSHGKPMTFSAIVGVSGPKVGAKSDSATQSLNDVYRLESMERGSSKLKNAGSFFASLSDNA